MSAGKALPKGAKGLKEYQRPTLRIDKQLRWWYEEEEILHPRLLTFLRRNLRYERDTGFFLEDQDGRVPVEVEDTPFLAHDFSVEGKDVSVRLPNEETRSLEAGSFRIGSNGGMYARVLPEGFEVRFSRQAQENLLQRHLIEKDGEFFLQLRDRLVPILASRS